MIAPYNWAILGPMRSGTRILIFVLQNYFLQYKVYLKYFNPNTDKSVFLNYKRPWILHSHDSNCIKYDFKNTKKIIVYRNPVDCALSRLLVDETKLYHAFSKNDILIDKLELDLTKFILYYSQATNFYEEIIAFNGTDVKKIYYDDYETNTTNIINLLNLNYLNNVVHYFKLPIKNNWNYQEIFKNWKTIQNVLIVYRNQDKILKSKFENMLTVT